MFNIFISYSQTELDWAEYIKRHLAIAGVNVYVAEYDLPAGNSLSADIASKIRESDLFVLLWTQNAKRSTYVNQEVFLAKSCGKKILPIILQNGVTLPRLLGDVKYLDIAKEPETQLAWLRAFVDSQAKSKTLANQVALGFLGFIAFVALRSGN